MADDRETVGGATLWFGVGGGAAAWILHLSVSYALVPHVCDTGRALFLYLTTGGAAAIALAATGSAWLARRRLGGTDDREDLMLPPPFRGTEQQPRRFLALGGILLSGFFLTLILFEGLPVLLLDDPCRVVPARESPIILLDRPTTTLAALWPGPIGIHASDARPRMGAGSGAAAAGGCGKR